MHTAHCTLHTAHYTLRTEHCTLHTAHCTTLHTAHYTLHTTHCTLHTAASPHSCTCRLASAMRGVGEAFLNWLQHYTALYTGLYSNVLYTLLYSTVLSWNLYSTPHYCTIYRLLGCIVHFCNTPFNDPCLQGLPLLWVIVANYWEGQATGEALEGEGNLSYIVFLFFTQPVFLLVCLSVCPQFFFTGLNWDLWSKIILLECQDYEIPY